MSPSPFEKFLDERRGARPPAEVERMVKRVWGEKGWTHALEESNQFRVATESDFEYTGTEEAVKAMRDSTRKARAARTRVLNKALREADIDPLHFHRLVQRHHSLTPEEFSRLIDLYREAPDRNSFSKSTHALPPPE